MHSPNVLEFVCPPGATQTGRETTGSNADREDLVVQESFQPGSFCNIVPRNHVTVLGGRCCCFQINDWGTE